MQQQFGILRLERPSWLNYSPNHPDSRLSPVLNLTDLGRFLHRKVELKSSISLHREVGLELTISVHKEVELEPTISLHRVQNVLWAFVVPARSACLLMALATRVGL